MTELTITPKVEDKTARFKGTIAAGEHVAVTIKGGAEWIGTDSGANLTLRVLDLVTGRTLAVFPYWTDDNSEDWPDDVTSADAWAPATDDANDLYCELNLNTTRMVAAARHMLRVPVMFVLGDAGDPRTLYFRDRYEVEYWPERIGDTTPYDLDNWPKKIDEWAELVGDWTERLDGMKLEATREDSPTSGNPYVEITLNDGTGGTDTKVKVYDGEVSAAQLAAALALKQDVLTFDNAPTAGSSNPVKSGGVKTEIDTVATSLSSHAGDGDIHVTSAQKAGWANKVANATAGNFAELDQYGNIADSGKDTSYFATSAQATNLGARISALEGSDSNKSARTIAAEEVAKIVASADTDFDTLKEIADWILNDTTGAAKMANDIADLKTDKADVADLATVATSGSYNDLSDKPTIPAPVDISGKVDGDAIYPEWLASPPNPYPGGAIVSHNGFLYQLGEEYAGTDSEPGVSEEWDAVRLEDLKQDALSASQLANIADVSNKANTSDVAAALAQKANASDLPYRLVEPGEWEFSGSGVDSGREYKMSFSSEQSEWTLNESTGDSEMPWIGIEIAYGTGAELSVEFDTVSITATRASLPGHLLDRAGNRVVVTGDTTLTLPAANPGYLRDFLVRLEISGSTVPTITFAAPTGETITYETDGDEFPVPDEAGTWLYSFTEVAAGTFAVSLKKVNTVAQAAQGGS